MAIKLIVEYTNLQAAIQSQELSLLVQPAESDSPSLQTSVVSPSVNVGVSTIAPISGTLLNYVQPNLLISSVNLFADIITDPDTKNLYFTGDNPNVVVLNILEDLAYSVNKPFADTFGFSDDTTFDISKALNDTTSITESIEILLEFLREFNDTTTIVDAPALLVSRPESDSFAFSDSQLFGFNKNHLDAFLIFENADFALGKNESDTIPLTDTQTFNTALPKQDDISVTESSAKSLSTSKTDSYSLTEQATLQPLLSKADILSMGESLSRTVSFNRSFLDVISLDDIASVDDPLQTDIASIKNNVAFLTEENIFSLSKALTDSTSIVEQIASSINKPESDTLSVNESATLLSSLSRSDILSISEQDVISFSKSIDDALTITENINFKVIVSSKSVLNIAALNTSALN
tara:strand:- start:1083 stop:2306 length:1224 start_codon:yes stop_codon:yes gene_type:complete